MRAQPLVCCILSRACRFAAYLSLTPTPCRTLAGGVVIGACCDMLNNPFGPLLTGAVAGTVSVYGFSYLVPTLKRLGLTDVCGISSLHLMPGFLGGIASAVAAATVTTETWSEDAIIHSFPARADRSAMMQGSYQMAMTVISLAFGLLSGALTGAICTYAFADPMSDSFYEDEGECGSKLAGGEVGGSV